MKRNDYKGMAYLGIFPYLQKVLNNCKCNCIKQLYIIVDVIILPCEAYNVGRIEDYK